MKSYNYLKISSIISLFFFNASCEKNEVENLLKEQPDLSVKEIKIENIKASAAESLLRENPNMTVLDIRTPKEFYLGHISKAINIDYKDDNFEEELKKLDRNQTYLMHCRSGRRSGLALENFSKLGFQHIIHVTDGILGWKEELVK